MRKDSYICIMTKSITPFSVNRVGNTDEYSVGWTEWDGHCMCTRLTKRGVVTVTNTQPNTIDNFQPSILDLEKAIRKKYYGNN